MKLKQPLSMQRLSPRSGENCAKNVACATTGLFSSLPIMNLITKALCMRFQGKEEWGARQENKIYKCIESKDVAMRRRRRG